MKEGGTHRLDHLRLERNPPNQQLKSLVLPSLFVVHHQCRPPDTGHSNREKATFHTTQARPAPCYPPLQWSGSDHAFNPRRPIGLSSRSTEAGEKTSGDLLGMVHAGD
jgi:hypothetical protein